MLRLRRSSSEIAAKSIFSLDAIFYVDLRSGKIIVVILSRLKNINTIFYICNSADKKFNFAVFV